jgi:hypothetical protein
MNTSIRIPATLQRTVAALALVSLSTFACERAAELETLEFEVTALDTLITLESELLAAPVDVTVDEDGNVYVLDARLASIVVLPVADGAPVTLGAQGAGPGELDGPGAVAVASDSIRVIDSGNGRVQVLTSDGTPVRSYPLTAERLGGIALNGNGHVAVSTHGLVEESLVLTFGPDGEPLAGIGAPVVPPHQFWDMAAIRAEILDGQVPQPLRNMSRPTLDSQGALWLALSTEGIVQRYDAEGTLLWALPLEEPEMPGIKERFFQRNRELNIPGFAVLSYVSDGVVVDGTLWLLLNVPDTDPCVVLVISGEGVLRQRLTFPNLTGATQLAVDPDRRLLYLAVPPMAGLVASTIP